jgi:4-hydroxy-3-polyprenylbenzoate decarboxylase
VIGLTLAGPGGSLTCMTPLRIVLAVTGAGGTRLAGSVLRRLADDERVGHIDLMVSANGRKLIGFEHGEDEQADPVRSLLGHDSAKISYWDPETDVAGPPSSGSYRSWGMIVIPCAVGVAGRVAQGTADTLIERAADVCLKERRPLVLCIRETPLNLIHLRNMVQLTEAGATIYPMIPTYYNVPQNLEQMDEEFVERLLGFIGLDQTDYYEWSSAGGSAAHDDHLKQAHREEASQ